MKIVILDGEPLNPGDVSWEPLKKLGWLEVHAATSDGDFAARVSGADVVLVNKTPVREPNLQYLSGCRLVGELATGTNNLDLAGLRALDVSVCNVPAYGADDVAQHTLALLLELARGTALHTQSVLAGEWRDSGKWCYWKKTPLNLAGLTAGIVGFGAIGQAFGRMVSALGMHVLAWSRKNRPAMAYPVEYVDLPQLWRRSNVISLHCPLAPMTENIINAAAIAAMPAGAVIINTARGGLVDESAAALALHSGKLAGLGSDVLSQEPPQADNPLLRAPNVLITPHMAWATARARQKIIDIMAENIKSFFTGKPENIVN